MDRIRLERRRRDRNLLVIRAALTTGVAGCAICCGGGGISISGGGMSIAVISRVPKLTSSVRNGGEYARKMKCAAVERTIARANVSFERRFRTPFALIASVGDRRIVPSRNSAQALLRRLFGVILRGIFGSSGLAGGL